ncbi:MAG: hypothetical protein LBV76_03500 [Deltaproteobacteria bacterium]|jgi:hypothetical protein|nr:hypothetical protein [Deltaproteobacteria bacterium]
MENQIEDLAESLSHDPNGKVLKQAQTFIGDMLIRMRSKMDAGLGTKEFAQARQLVEAIEAADATCVTYWEHWQRNIK